MRVESGLPKQLWHHAVQTAAAAVRNKCFTRRTGQTLSQLTTGKKANLSEMQQFPFECDTYKQVKDMVDGYDKNSPAYFVYPSDTNKVLRRRLVKFGGKIAARKQTQTSHPACDL